MRWNNALKGKLAADPDATSIVLTRDECNELLQTVIQLMVKPTALVEEVSARQPVAPVRPVSPARPVSLARPPPPVEAPPSPVKPPAADPAPPPSPDPKVVYLSDVTVVDTETDA